MRTISMFLGIMFLLMGAWFLLQGFLQSIDSRFYDNTYTCRAEGSAGDTRCSYDDDPGQAVADHGGAIQKTVSGAGLLVSGSLLMVGVMLTKPTPQPGSPFGGQNGVPYRT